MGVWTPDKNFLNFENVKSNVLENSFKFDKLVLVHIEGAKRMSNKKFQKIVVYSMVVIMLISTVAMGVAAIM